jgi:hypothetical protein
MSKKKYLKDIPPPLVAQSEETYLYNNSGNKTDE